MCLAVDAPFLSESDDVYIHMLVYYVAYTQVLAKQMANVAKQCFLYVAAYIVAYLPSVIVVLATGFGTRDKTQSLYPLVVCQVLLHPSQGTLNFVVYMRPRYIQARESLVMGQDALSPLSLQWQAICLALHGDKAVSNPEDGLVESLASATNDETPRSVAEVLSSEMIAVETSTAVSISPVHEETAATLASHGDAEQPIATPIEVCSEMCGPVTDGVGTNCVDGK